MRIIAVDEDKITPNFIEKDYELINIPTIIFMIMKMKLIELLSFQLKVLKKIF